MGSPTSLASDHPALAYRDNLRLLARAPGLEMLLIGRPVRAATASVEALAVAPSTGATGWTLPPALSGHVDLAYDRLSAAADGDADAAADEKRLHQARRAVERAIHALGAER